MNRTVKISFYAIIDDSIIEKLTDTVTNNLEKILNIEDIPKISIVFGGNMKLINFPKDNEEDKSYIGCIYDNII